MKYPWYYAFEVRKDRLLKIKINSISFLYEIEFYLVDISETVQKSNYSDIFVSRFFSTVFLSNVWDESVYLRC